MDLISLNVCQRNSGLCPTPHAENFAKVFYWINTVKYFGKKLLVLMFDGSLIGIDVNLSLHLPSVNFNQFVNMLFIVLLQISKRTLHVNVKEKVEKRKKMRKSAVLKAEKLIFQFGINCGSWCHEVFMLFLSSYFYLINDTKSGSLKTRLSNDIWFQTSRWNRYILS